MATPRRTTKVTVRSSPPPGLSDLMSGLAPYQPPKPPKAKAPPAKKGKK